MGGVAGFVCKIPWLCENVLGVFALEDILPSAERRRHASIAAMRGFTPMIEIMRFRL